MPPGCLDARNALEAHNERGAGDGCRPGKFFRRRTRTAGTGTFPTSGNVQIAMLIPAWPTVVGCYTESIPEAGVAELADARDSKSRALHWACGFDPHLQHHEQPLPQPLTRSVLCTCRKKLLPDFPRNYGLGSIVEFPSEAIICQEAGVSLSPALS